MSRTISLYPVLTDDLLSSIGLQVVDYEFEYNSDNQTRKLSARPLVGQEHILTRLSLVDDSGDWDPDRHNLRFSRKIVIPNTHFLFGRQGIAPRNAEIGIAVEWTSKPSRQRGVFVGDVITLDDDKKVFYVGGEFQPGTLREHFNLSIILYLKTPGNLHDGEQHLANVSGIELGILDQFSFFLSGEGSYFPIYTINDNGPLWRIECYWDDPRIEPFDDSSFRVLLNAKHPDYKQIHSPDGKSLSPLMKEIFLSSIQILMENVFRQVPASEVIGGRDLDRGSLCMAVKYFVDTFGLNINTKEGLAFSLRDKIYDNFGGIGK